MKRVFSAIVAILASFSLLSAQDGLNCFGILAGKNATVDGSVLLAHNEDDTGEQMLNIYNVPRNDAAGTNKYLWIEFPGMEVADGFLNEYGVAVASDACTSREDREDLTDGGVLYEIRTLVGQKARSARHAVELIGKLVEERGYRGSGRTYIVADPDEGWVCAIVKGRHWVAQRVPDDKVMAIPNYYCIGEVDLSDTANFMGSPDIITYAVERGWYNPETDGKFLFKKAYSRPSTYSSKMNYIRHMSALNYLTGETYTTNPDTYPFAVTPNRKVGLRDMMEILRSHGENIDVKMDIEEGEQHPWCICRNSTVNSTIFQLRSYLPVEIGALMWTTGAAPCAEVYIPWYSGMTKSPAGFQRFASADEAIEKHMSDAKDKRVKYPDGVAWKFVDKWNWIHENYTERIKGVRKANNKFQEKLFKNQTKFEKSLKNKSGNELQDELNRYTADIYQEYFKLF